MALRHRVERQFLPLARLRALVKRLAPHRDVILDRWVKYYVRVFGKAGFFTPEALRPVLASEFLAMIDSLTALGPEEDLDAFCAGLKAKGEEYARMGVPYQEVVVSMNLFEESCIAALREMGDSPQKLLANYLVFDKLSHFRMLILAEAYFYRYTQIIHEKTRELAQAQDSHERALMRAEKLAALGQLAAGFAHEINTPLGTIAITAAELEERLKESADPEGVPPGEATQMLARIGREVGRCKAIVVNLLELSRVRPPTVEAVHLDDLVERVREMASYQVEQQGKHMELDLSDAAAMIRSDGALLEQVLLSLVSNAIDATARGGHIAVRTRRENAHILLEVVDDGCGIPAQHLARLFEPFFTTKPPGKGTGLGLALAYSAVRKLGGQLSLESQVSKGTRARISLPIDGPPHED